MLRYNSHLFPKRNYARFKSQTKPSVTIEITTPDISKKDLEILLQPKEEETNFTKLQPEQIKLELDKWVIGQDEAKIAISVALRNRWRRSLLSEEIRNEIIPKNILMIGPSGCGKTEIARRMASLAAAPFIKVEASKYTEVGYKGADVETIIQDLATASIQKITARFKSALEKRALVYFDESIISGIAGPDADETTKNNTRNELNIGLLEDLKVNVKVDGTPVTESPSITIKELRGSLYERIINKEIPNLSEQFKKTITARGLFEAQEYGIVYIDEIDKIVSNRVRTHSDASDEGVQRDLLPIIEGTKVKIQQGQNSIGEIDTSKILFICAGAFLQSKPQDLISELQGRLPIRIELKSLTDKDMYRILTEPEVPLIQVEKVMLKTEGVDLRFTDEAIKAIASFAHKINDTVENIGARRLHTVLERILEDISFNAEDYKGQTVIIDEDYIQQRLQEFTDKVELKRYIL